MCPFLYRESQNPVCCIVCMKMDVLLKKCVVRGRLQRKWGTVALSWGLCISRMGNGVCLPAGNYDFSSFYLKFYCSCIFILWRQKSSRVNAPLNVSVCFLSVSADCITVVLFTCFSFLFPGIYTVSQPPSCFQIA